MSSSEADITTFIEPVPVDLMGLLTPDNVGSGDRKLVISGLGGKVLELARGQLARVGRYMNADSGSYEEQAAEEQLLSFYVAAAAAQVAEADKKDDLADRDFWSRWCTGASLELYGGPDMGVSRRLLRDEVTDLRSLQGDGRISQRHLEQLFTTDMPILEALSTRVDLSKAEALPAVGEKEVLRRYGEALRGLFPGFFAIVDAAIEDKQLLNRDELLTLCNELFHHLADKDDSSWGDQNWEAVLADGALFAIDTDICKLLIGRNRVPVPVGMVAGLVSHELLGHAMAAKNGYKVSDAALAMRTGCGLPGVNVSEEGRQCVLEASITGEMPGKLIDRELDVGLALGAYDGIRRSRFEVFDISYARQLVRAQRQGASAEEIANINQATQQHVDRIFSAGPGDDRGEHHALNVRDLVYPRGYRNTMRYMSQQMTAGITGQQLYRFFSHGIFDAANPEHIQHVMRTYGYTDASQLYT